MFGTRAAPETTSKGVKCDACSRSSTTRGFIRRWAPVFAPRGRRYRRWRLFRGEDGTADKFASCRSRFSQIDAGRDFQRTRKERRPRLAGPGTGVEITKQARPCLAIGECGKPATSTRRRNRKCNRLNYLLAMDCILPLAEARQVERSTVKIRPREDFGTCLQPREPCF